MSSIIFFKTGIRARSKEKKKVLRKFICLFVILVLLLNFLSTKNNNYQSDYFNNEGNSLKEEKLEKNLDCLKVSQGAIGLLQDPYTINFSKMWTFFQSNFKSPLTYDISLYVSESDNTGTVIDNTTYSLDNLLLYKSLVKEDYDESDTFQAYLDLKSTPLWYYYNISQYGFIKSINGSTGKIIDSDRYLIDNLMPIFLLLENIGNEIGSISIDGETPRDSIIQMFSLINSSEFWDSIKNGFYEKNSTAGDKDVKSNLYAVLANFLIHQYKDALTNDAVSDKAYERAEITMEILINKTWDNSNGGFYYKSNSDWTPYVFPHPNNHKYLSVNALGIIALLEYWIMTGMNHSSDYFKNATALYNKMSEPADSGGMWNSTYNAYEYRKSETWLILAPAQTTRRIDLEGNALMMYACLKLFEVTGNITYYNRAIQLYNFFENNLYNNVKNAYKTSTGSVDNTNINLYNNLRLCEAYLKAFEIYNSTNLDTSLITAGGGIMNQDILNLTSVYAFEKDIRFYEPSDDYDTKTIRYDNITGTSITYIFRYPNNTIFNITKRTFNTNTTTLQFPITDSLPFDNGYIIDIYANWTYFGFAFTTKTFNVISGLTYLSISGLREWLYQGEKTNISILISSNYNYSLTLNVTMFGDGILTVTRENITFINNNHTSIAFNITVKNDATPGKMNITFTFINGSVLYLKKEIEIEIRNALSFSNLIYSKKVVPGNSVQIFLDLINALPNETQSLNLIFSGKYVHDINKSIILDEDERRTVLYLVYTTSVILISSIEIEMSISKGKTTFYTETLTVEIVPSLEVSSIEFPEKVTQGTYAYFIIVIHNNQESAEEFSLLINGDKIDTEIDELIPGENRIEQEVLPTWNPYEFGIKTYKIEIEDSSEEVVFKDYFEYEIEMSAINLICFYMIPIIIPLGIILYYKNKEIKHKLLRR